MSKEEVKRIVAALLTEEEMHGSVSGQLDSGEHPYGDHPSLSREMSAQLGRDLFSDIVDRVKSYSGEESFNKMSAQQLMYGALGEALEIEQEHKDDLEALAVKVVSGEFGIGPDVVEFDAKLTPRGASFAKVKTQQAQVEKPEGHTDEKLSAEISKRKLINSMIHGGARRGQYMFHEVEDELRNIDNDLVKLYGTLMSVNDFNYWAFSDAEIASLGQQSSQRAGSVHVEKIEREEGEPGPLWKIVAEGMSFPLLLHELNKGVLELISIHGLPEDKEVHKYVLSKTDLLDSETWDLKIGPGVWDRFVDAVGDDAEVRSHLYQELVSLPAEEFNHKMKELIEGSDEGKQWLVDLANEIKDEIKHEDYEDAMKQQSSDDDEGGDDDDDGYGELDADDIDISDLFK